MLVVKLILWVGVNARPRTTLEDAHVRVPVSLVRSCVVHLFVFVYSVGSIGGCRAHKAGAGGYYAFSL